MYVYGYIYYYITPYSVTYLYILIINTCMRSGATITFNLKKEDNNNPVICESNLNVAIGDIYYCAVRKNSNTSPG